MGIAKSKNLDEIVDLLEKEEKFKDVHIVSRPHMRLYKAEGAY
jgi:folylpolyglutamate synthase/dihydropteroate synthase